MRVATLSKADQMLAFDDGCPLIPEGRMLTQAIKEALLLGEFDKIELDRQVANLDRLLVEVIDYRMAKAAKRGEAEMMRLLPAYQQEIALDAYLSTNPIPAEIYLGE